MTLQDAKEMTTTTINAEAAGAILGASPQAIRIQARTAPEKLGFPVVVIGQRVKIPRLPFIAFVEGGNSNGHVEAQK
jgi:hypothetical protein